MGGLSRTSGESHSGMKRKKFFEKKLKKQLDKENGIVLNGRPFHEEPKFLLRNGVNRKS